MDRNEVIRLVEAFDASTDGMARKSRELILLLLQQSPSPFSRNEFTPGHITCTGLVLAPEGDAVLMVHHARLNRWLMPGGHAEPGDESPFAASMREVLEETSVELDPAFAPRLAGMDVHGIPAKRGEPYHLHHDLIVAFRARGRAVARSEESHAVEWVAICELDQRDAPEPVQTSLARVRCWKV